jgi:hypothetical protein
MTTTERGDPPFPVRGTVGGFHDPWDDPCDLRAEQAHKGARPHPGRPRDSA